MFTGNHIPAKGIASMSLSCRSCMTGFRLLLAATLALALSACGGSVGGGSNQASISFLLTPNLSQRVVDQNTMRVSVIFDKGTSRERTHIIDRPDRYDYLYLYETGNDQIRFTVPAEPGHHTVSFSISKDEDPTSDHDDVELVHNESECDVDGNHANDQEIDEFDYPDDDKDGYSNHDEEEEGTDHHDPHSHPNYPPVVVLGPDQTVPEGTLVTVDASASSDYEKSPLTFIWTQLPTSPPVVLTDADKAIATFTAPLVAQDTVLAFQVAVSDGASTTTGVTLITVLNTDNEPPSANAGAPQTVGENLPVSLDGSQSSDPNGNPLTFAWIQTGGPTVSLTGANTANPTFTSPFVLSVQVLQFSLTVTDSWGATSLATTTVTVLDNINELPIANAGPDQTVGEQVTVVLDGSASSDPNGEAITYSWTQIGGPAVLLTGNDTATPAFTSPLVTGPTTLTFQLMVSDSRGGASLATTTVTVVDTINDAPVANAGPPQTVGEQVPVVLDATGSTDPNGNPLTFLWTQTGGQAVTLSGATTATPAFTSPTVLTDSVLTFSVAVSDGTYTTTATTTVTVVNDVNEVPVASAGAPQTVTEGASVTLSGSATDPNGEAITFAWTQTGGPAVTLIGANTATPTFTAPLVTASTVLTFELVVTDSLGGASSPASTTVTVLDSVNDAPLANAGAPQTVGEQVPVTLSAAGSSDPNNDPLTFTWTQTGGPAVSLTGAATGQPGFTSPTVLADTVLTFSVAVSDGASTTTATTTVTVVNDVNEAPTADAGAPQTVGGGVLVTLTGSGSDPNGDAITFAWTQSGGEPVTLSGATTATPTLTTPSVAGPLTFTLVVTDSLAAASLPATTTVSVVIGASGAPSANAGPGQVVGEGVAVTLDASGSTDPNNDPLTFVWTQTGGPLVSLTGGNTAQPGFTSPTVLVDTVLTFTVAVSDGTNTTTATTTVTVINDVNEPPTASAGPNQTVGEQVPVTLSGSGSDPNGGLVTFAWTQVGGPTVALTGANTATPSLTTPMVSGLTVLIFELVVTDAQGGVSLPATTTVTVLDSVNDAPLADAGAPQTVGEGVAVGLSAAGSSDPNGDPLTFLWTQTGGPTVILTGTTTVAPAFISPTVLADTVLSFDVAVSDGTTTTAASTTVTVLNDVNELPTAAAGAGQTVAEGVLVTLTGSGSDPNGDPITFAWTQTGGPSVALTGATTATPTFISPTVPAPTVLIFELAVTDSLGGASPPATTTVTVINGANIPPVASAGAPQTVNELAPVALNATLSYDPDGDPITFAWTQTGGPSVTLSGASTATPAFTSPRVLASTALTFSVAVSDGIATSSATTTVTVLNNLNESPVADAGPSKTVGENLPVALDGNASYDPNGDPITYVWVQTGGPAVTLTGGNTVLPLFTSPTVTVLTDLTFELVVIDIHNAVSAPSATTVTVSPAVNLPPVADAGADQSVPATVTVTLDGSASSDPEGDPLTFAWLQTAGPAVTLSDPAAVMPTFVAPGPGPLTLTFDLTVTDSRGAASLPTTTTVTVTGGVNQPPTADAGPMRYGRAGSPVTASASASIDPDGHSLHYQWQVPTGVPVVGGLNRSTLTVITPDHVHGPITVSLTVSDGLLTSPPATTQVQGIPITGNARHTCVIRGDQSLWCWGDNTDGKLGDGTTVNRAAAVEPVSGSTWRSVSAGPASTCGIRTDGSLWCWGEPLIGVGQWTSPIQVAPTADWSHVGTGADHACAIKTDGSLWCWGTGTRGQLGQGDPANPGALEGLLNISLPTRVGLDTNWRQVAPGGGHTCAVRTDDTLWCWGSAGYEYGAPTPIPFAYITSPIPMHTADNWASVTVGEHGTCATPTSGGVVCWGENATGNAVTVDATGDWRQVGMGVARASAVQNESAYACGVKGDGTLWCWGAPNYLWGGLIPLPYSPTAITRVNADTDWMTAIPGAFHVCAMKGDGSVLCWGNNQHGQQGRDVPVYITSPQPVVTAIADWQQLSANDNRSCATRADNTLWCWGNHMLTTGVLDGADITPSDTALDTAPGGLGLGTGHSCLIRPDGTLWCWGANRFGQLGQGSTEALPDSVPLQVGFATDWVAVAPGGLFTCAIRQNPLGERTLWCWGSNDRGQVGIGSTGLPVVWPTQVEAQIDWDMVSTSGVSACGIRDNPVDGRTLWCWGETWLDLPIGGLTKDGFRDFPTSPTRVDLATNWAEVGVSDNHACARRTDNTLWCWGRNRYWEVGNNSGSYQLSPLQIGLAEWASISVSPIEPYSCAIKTDGTLWCWGRNRTGALGNGRYEIGTVFNLESRPAQVGVDTDWVSVSAGFPNVCGIRQAGIPAQRTAWCWGSDWGGAVGIGAGYNEQIVPITLPLP